MGTPADLAMTTAIGDVVARVMHPDENPLIFSERT
jgi:hypothetical protein